VQSGFPSRNTFFSGSAVRSLSAEKFNCRKKFNTFKIKALKIVTSLFLRSSVVILLKLTINFKKSYLLAPKQEILLFERSIDKIGADEMEFMQFRTFCRFEG